MTNPAHIFSDRFGGPPTHVARAPGRVNLIGEHIDYCGLAVLPIAISRSIRILFRARGDAQVRIASTLPGADARNFELGSEIAPFGPGDWGNYPKAAARAVARGYGAAPRGIDALVVSDLPPASGLSSSSALVVACALALLAANGRALAPHDADRRDLARRLAAGERFVGTAGGGMDQAISLLAREGHALRIAFDPLRTAPIPVPSSWGFVVAFSLEAAEKSGAAREIYNLRTRECAEALQRVAEREGEGDGVNRPPATYARLLSTLGPSALLDQSADLEPPLDRRFRHVVSEAARVDKAERALRDADLEAFGAVLLGGHQSLRDDYDVSTLALDRLVSLAVEAGAVGARLTGAGLGGSVVTVCEACRAPEIIAALRDRFYAERSHAGLLADWLFEVRPAAGARVEPLAS